MAKQIVKLEVSISAEDIFDAYEFVEERLMDLMLHESRVSAVTMFDQRCPKGCSLWPCRHYEEFKNS